MKKILFFVALLWMFNLSVAQAQQALATSGGNASGSGATVSYTVGQVIYSYYDGATGSIEQGVQHAYEIYLVNTNFEVDPNFVVSIFPNPTSNILNLRIEHLDSKRLTYRLVDADGNLLKKKPIEMNQTQIEMKSLPSATYFVQIYQDNQHLKSFKIIKN